MDKRQSEERSRDLFLDELVRGRQARGQSIRQFAQELGVSATFVSLVEAGKKTPGEDLAARWAELLGINPRVFLAWIRSRPREDVQAALQGSAEYRYVLEDPNVQVRVAGFDQIGFEPATPQGKPRRTQEAKSPASTREGVLRVPLIREGSDPSTEPEPLDYVTVQEELLRGERLVRPFAYRLSTQGVLRVFRTLQAGDYAIVSRESGPPDRREIYAVRVRNRIVLGRVMERGSDILLLLSDQGEAEIEALRAEGGKARSLIVGRVVAAIRPLHYSVVKPTGRGSEER
jgi:transcriptional regulator with XRE-family HTH domain